MTKSLLHDAAVLGAGPAGSAAALLLARMGFRVALLDKAPSFPRHKLCGSFLSPDGVRLLTELCPGAGNALPRREIGGVVLHAPSGRTLRIEMPRPAWGVGREELDAFLFHEAQAVGAEAFLGARLKDFSEENGAFRLTLLRRPEDGIFHLAARCLVAADGHHTSLAAPMKTEDFLAVQTSFAAPEAAPRLDFHIGSAGYGGFLPTGGGWGNFCFLLRRCPQGGTARPWPEALRGAGAVLGHLPAKSEWHATASLSWGWREPLHPGVFLAGDAACALPPLAGDGMAMALEGAALAAHGVERALHGTNLKGAVSEASRAMREKFRSRMRTARVLAALMRLPMGAEALLAAGALFPSLPERALRGTRGKF